VTAIDNAPLASDLAPVAGLSPVHSEEVASVIAATESAVLGAILYESSFLDKATNLTADMFHRAVHQDIFSLMNDISEASQHLDALAFSQEVYRTKKLNDRQREAISRSLPHLITMSRYATTEDAFLHGVKEIRGYAAQRELERMGLQFGQLAASATLDDIGQAVERAQEILSVGITGQPDAQERTMCDIVEGRIENIGKVKSADVIKTPFRDLNGLLGRGHGINRKTLTIIGARPSIGKSTVALDLARHASKIGLRVLFISLEMDEEHLSSRFLAAESYVLLSKIQNMETEPDNITEAEWGRINQTRAKLAETEENLALIDSSRAYVDGKFTVATLRRRLEGARRRGKPIDMVVLDYIGLMDPAEKAESRQVEVTQISRSLKTMSGTFNVAMVALSQLNRLSTQRSDHRPMMSDLRESGAVEQDADMVILLHRDDAYESESPRAGEMDLMVVKNREGATATLTVAFQGHYSRAVDMASP
jgi:replicative DNA helicase